LTVPVRADLPSAAWTAFSAGSAIIKLHGYRVLIGQYAGGSCVCLMPGGEWTERCLRARSFGHAAWLARAWIEKRGDKRLSKQK
jgi:hypothetical protein